MEKTGSARSLNAVFFAQRCSAKNAAARPTSLQYRLVAAIYPIRGGLCPLELPLYSLLIPVFFDNLKEGPASRRSFFYDYSFFFRCRMYAPAQMRIAAAETARPV